MIGPGTGLAPFISFLRSLNNTTTQAPLWLFYGCRHPDHDWLFKNELLGSLRPLLTKLSVSFSRHKCDETTATTLGFDYTPGGSKYVQDAIRHYSKEIVELINVKNASVYVCGDAKNMAKDVHACLGELLRVELNLSELEANKYLTDLVKAKRYKQDIWA
jgi:sulfite reductase alpha subunit-like flavoprotein